MSLRGLLVLVLALAVVVGVLLWAGKKPPAEPPPAEKAPLVAAFQEKDVTAVKASCGAEAAWTIERAASGWRLAAREADPRRVHDLIAAVQDARVAKIVDEGSVDRKAYGLEPGCTLDLTLSGGAARAVRLGRTSPVGAERYALLGDGRLGLTDGSLYGMIDRSAGALEERRLFPVEAPAVRRIAIEGPDGRLALESGETGWRVVAPFADRASESACSRLATALTSLAVDEVAAPDRPGHGPKIVLELSSKEGAPRRVDLSVVAKDGKRSAWRGDGSLAGTVADATVREIDLLPDAYRERRIATFSAPDLRAIRIDRGALHLEATRAEGETSWRGADAGTPFLVDRAPVDALVERLRGLTASGFVAGAPPSPATGTIVARGDQGELTRLEWGPLAPEPGTSGESVWVTAADRPGVVFRVPATSIGPVPSKASEWTEVPKGK